MKAHYKHEHSELESYKVTAYPKNPNPNAISASLALSLSLQLRPTMNSWLLPPILL